MKTHPQISGLQLNVEEKHLCLNEQHILCFILCVTAERERVRATLRRERAHGESIIPGDFKSFAWGKCDFAKACLQKGWQFWVIFSFYLPFFLLLLLFFLHSFLHSSPLSILLLFRGGLLSPLKHLCAHRYYWGLTVHLNTPVCMCILEGEWKRDGLI